MTDEKKIAVVLTYILEDDKITTELIYEVLKANSIFDFRIFNSSSELIANLSPEVQICVLDYYLNETLTGLDVMKIVLNHNPDCYVIIISGQDDCNVIAEFLNNGARRYVNKNAPKYLDKMVDFILQGVKEVRKNLEKKALIENIQNKLSDMQKPNYEKRNDGAYY